MKYIKRVLLFLLAIASLYGIGRLVDVLYGSYLFLPRQPYLQMQTQNSIMIKWQTPKAEKGVVEYGAGLHVSEKESSKYHSITIKNLQPQTCYKYHVSSASLQIDNTKREFCTLNTNKKMETLWVVGDTGEDSPKQKNVYQSMLSYVDNNLSKIDLWLLLGDNAYSSGTQKQYNRDLFDAYPALIKQKNIWAAIGNHDSRRFAFSNIFDFPTHGESGGIASGTKKYYSIDEANFHLVILDSQTEDLSADGKMANWLKEDLAHNTKPWTFIAFHHPPYCDTTHDSDNPKDSGGRLKAMRENFTPIFDKYDVDLVLTGHSHVYERSKLLVGLRGDSKTFNPAVNVKEDSLINYTKPLEKTPNTGVVYVVDGSGSKADTGDFKNPALSVGYHIAGSVILEVTPTTLSEKFITEKGEIKDSFTIEKK